MRDYCGVVQSYSQRKLTYASDKLPAFSGISSQLQSVIGGTYLAGLWSTHLIVGLLWQREMATCAHVLPYRAPSWSWAVTDESIVYYDQEIKYKHASAIKLLSHQVTPKIAEAPYGEVTFASITVSGLVMRFVRSEQSVKGYLGDEYYYGLASLDENPARLDVRDVEGELPAFIRTSPALFILSDGNGPYILAINHSHGPKLELNIDFGLVTDETYLAVMVYIDEEANGHREAKSAKGLIVKPVGEQDASGELLYERVGVFDFRDFEMAWVSEWKWKTLVLV